MALEMHTRPMFSRSAQRELPVVLLIDDDLVSREVTATILTMSGYTVHTAVSGAGSLEMLGATPTFRPDVILMDAQMPGLSGPELIAELRARAKALIYVVSGSEPPPEIAAAADGFLLKPFDVDALRRLLHEHKTGAPSPLLDPNAPVVSAEVLAQLRKIMPESAVRQIYSAVIVDLARRMDALDAAIAKGDAAEIRRIGHAIKGACGMAGALQTARLGALLESEDNHLDNSASLLRDLRAAVRGLERMLDAELPA